MSIAGDSPVEIHVVSRIRVRYVHISKVGRVSQCSSPEEDNRYGLYCVGGVPPLLVLPIDVFVGCGILAPSVQDTWFIFTLRRFQLACLRACAPRCLFTCVSVFGPQQGDTWAQRSVLVNV